MFRSYTKPARSIQQGAMLYSQALAGHHRPPGPSSSQTITTTQEDTAPTTGSTPRGEIKQPHNTKANHHPQVPRQRCHQPNNPHHKPNTITSTTSTKEKEEEETVYVLTLTTTPSLTDPLTALRRAHFPLHRGSDTSRNLPAHLTLFHALPGSELERRIVPDLEEICCYYSVKTTDTAAAAAAAATTATQHRQKTPIKLSIGSPFRMRRGVGINLAEDPNPNSSTAAAARALHAALQDRWRDLLSAQDSRRPWRPHWTVQNKVPAGDETDAAIEACLRDVRTKFQPGDPAEGFATGVALWRYERGGRWTFKRGFEFGGGSGE